MWCFIDARHLEAFATQAGEHGLWHAEHRWLDSEAEGEHAQQGAPREGEGQGQDREAHRLDGLWNEQAEHAVQAEQAHAYRLLRTLDMNDHRLKRLKRLAAGAAIVTSTLVSAGDPPKPQQKPNVNSPPEPEPKPEPIYVNSPKPVEAKPDAGTPVAEPPKQKPRPPNVNSTPPLKK